MRVAAALTECLKAFRDGEGERTILVLGTASSASDVAPLLRRCFTHELKAGKADLHCPLTWDNMCSINESHKAVMKLPSPCTLLFIFAFTSLVAKHYLRTS